MVPSFMSQGQFENYIYSTFQYKIQHYFHITGWEKDDNWMVILPFDDKIRAYYWIKENQNLNTCDKRAIFGIYSQRQIKAKGELLVW